ncbi:tail fiber domain-containing protein [bacterium]|nr:tail fiber domain-containing protein [bacterium]
MPNDITKIIIRRGFDAQRRTTNTTGIAFEIGEPAYCIDTQRLYIGNGQYGGIAVGMRNLGAVNALFGNYNNSGFSQQAYNVLALSGSEQGDIIFDKSTRTIYSLSARSNYSSSNVPLSSDFQAYDVGTLINSSEFFYDANQQLNLQTQAVTVTKLNSNAVDGLTIVKPSAAAQIAIAPGSVSTGVANTNLQHIAANSLYANITNGVAGPAILSVQPNQVVGRTSSSTLSAININEVIAASTLTGSNGITVVNIPAGATFSIDSNYMTLASSKVNISVPTTVTGTLCSKSTIISDGDIIAFYTSDVTMKQNIKKIETPLQKLNKISGYNFDWKPGCNEHLHGADTGVIAQEVEQVVPEAVQSRNSGVKAVNYQKLIPLLIESIKELNDKLEQKK